MSGRLFAAILAVLGIAAVLGAAFGEQYKLLVLAGLAAVGAAATLAREWLLRGLASALGRLHPDWRPTALTYLEGLELRPELADRLAEPLPLVPIRRGEERYAYPRATAAIMWAMRSCPAAPRAEQCA